MTIVRTQAEIDAQLNKAADGENGGTLYPGMSYEQGITAMYQWLTGETESLPMEEFDEEDGITAAGHGYNQ